MAKGSKILVPPKNELKKACEGGEMRSCWYLGGKEKRDGNIAQAKILYEKACKADLFAACLDLERLEYKNGNIAKSREILRMLRKSKVCDLKEYSYSPASKDSFLTR